MTLLKRSKVVLFVGSLFVATGLLTAQQPATPAAAQAAALGLQQAIPVNPQITVGALPNGLRYYVRANKQPEKRAELRLVVKAGSILEDDDQQGLAHFVEHMAFNGTKNYPGDGVVQFLQSLGMRFGADVNAYTSFNETVFMLTVPTDQPNVLDKSMLILEDWARNVTFDPKEIDKERGVVTEEWRVRRGAAARTQEKAWPVLLKGSRYVDRLPIGKTDIIQNFTPDTLKRFYADWYRPDLMAVVAVGDFDGAAVEAMIKTHFAPLTAPTSARRRPVYDVPNHTGTVFAINTDKETTSTMVELDNLLPAREEGSVGVYREKIVDRLFSSMLSSRLSEISQQADAPFMMAFAGRGAFVAPTKDTASLVAIVKDGGVEKGVEALVAEAERVTKFGFTATELDRQRQEILTNYERMVTQKDARTSASHAAEYIRNFLTGESLPGPDLENALQRRFLPGVTLDEVNKVARAWFSDQNRMVVINAPEKAGLTMPDEAKVAAAIATGSTKALVAYTDTVGTQPLLETTPTPGAVVKTSTRSPGITEWELANGVKVVLMPTKFRADEIVFRATSPGGTSLASDADYIPASTASALVAAGGVGTFSSIDLNKKLTGKVAGAAPFIGELESSLSGSSSGKDLETTFQLIYLRFTAPRADPAIFAVRASQQKASLANLSVSPDIAFNRAITAVMGQNHPRRQVATAATVDQWNLEKSMAFYKERFADASGFTFIFVGDFEVPAIQPLVERYLGSLPSLRRRETWKDVGARLPTGVIERTVEKGIEPKSQVALVFNGPFVYDQTQRVAIRALTQVLQTRLRDTIREELGGTYSVTVSFGFQKIPNSEFTMTIQFGSDPTRTGDLVKRVLQEVEVLKTSGPSAQQVADVSAALLREFETNSKLNPYLLSQMVGKYEYGEDPATLWLVPDYYKKIDVAMVQQAARTYLDGANRVQVTLVPEKK
jgi:zinc protease